MSRVPGFKHHAGPVLCALLLSGCVTTPADEQIALADSESALNYNKPNWHTPFWQQNIPQPVAGKPAPVTPATSAQGSGQILTNVAIVADPASDRQALPWPANLQTEAANAGFRLIPQDVVAEAIRRLPACSEGPSLACANALAIYPGVRLLIQISDNRQAIVVDSSIDRAYPPVLLDKGDPIGSALETARHQAQLGPWVLKAFTGDDGRLYISAGRHNGVKVGDQLTVHQPGRLVRAPSGQPVAWRTGPTTGRVRVSELVGDELAAIVSVAGKAPERDNELLFAPRP